MSFFKKIILFLCIVFTLTGCEDTKSKKTNFTKENTKQTEQERKRDSILKNLKIPSDGSEIDIDLSKVRTINQKELIPYLTKYGKENPETHILISCSYGDIEVKLYSDTPLHRANFIRLVKMGYFNTTVFHRVSKDFVVQGGNSGDVGTQKIRKKVGNFLLPNEANRNHLHVRGAFSMAKYTEQNISNASSPFEFFIVQSKSGAHHLDGKHTVFGKVIKGMDVVDKIAQVPVDASEWPIDNIYLTIKVLD